MKRAISRAALLHLLGTLVAFAFIAAGLRVAPGGTNRANPMWDVALAFFNAGGALAAALVLLGLVMLARTNWLLVISIVACLLLFLLWVTLPFYP